MRLPPFPRTEWAWFFDLDGTLAQIAARPDAVVIDDTTRYMLATLADRTAGAVAIVSGRSIADIDRLLGGSVPAVAGQHGNERRTSNGDVEQHAKRTPTIEWVAGELQAFAAAHPGVVVEDKGLSLAVHFRLVPAFEEVVCAKIEELQRTFDGDLLVQGGKFVFEIVPVGRHKGNAVLDFMRESPFAGRTPAFLGDDVTDEHAFMVVNQLGGHSIKVGAGDTIAQYRLRDVAAVQEWVLQVCGTTAEAGRPTT